MRKILITLATILAGTHNASVVLAQYGYSPGFRYAPRWQRPPAYDRPYDRRQRDWITPDEQRFNHQMRRFRQYEQYQQGPWRTY